MSTVLLFAAQVSENYGKRVGMWIEDTVRLRMPIAYLADGREVERPCKTWIPEKTIKAFNHRYCTRCRARAAGHYLRCHCMLYNLSTMDEKHNSVANACT